MLRTALTPRWLGLLALLVALVVTFSWLGLWQLDVARSKGSESSMSVAKTTQPQPLEEVMKPHQSFPDNGSLKPVTATGHYDAAHQVLISGRLLHGKRGYWVLTPLVVQGSGARVAIIRGFVSSPSDAKPPSTGDRQVTVTGALAPGESPSTGHHPKGQLGSVDLGYLLNKWGGTMYNAFIFKTAESPKATSAPIQSFPPPKPASHSGLKPLNAGYALQWWFFALFAIYLYWKMLGDEVHGSRRSRREDTTGRQEPDGERDNDGVRDMHSKDAHA